MTDRDPDNIALHTEPSHRTLVLNASYEPMMVIGWQRAITMVYLEKAEPIAHYDRHICSVSTRVLLPAVVRLHRRTPRRKFAIRFSRTNVYARDKSTCQYCGEVCPTNELTYDHVIPKVLGGKTGWQNIVTCCVPCNREKGGRTPEQAGMRLLKPPTRPNWLPVIGRSLLSNNPPEAWRPFLWHV